jgi:uncharacterized protein (DUF305 family)
MRRRLIGLAVVVAVLAACGGGSSKPYNSADVAFAQGMIPHHQQAIEMATMAGAHAESPAVQQLAARIQSAQQPEIQQMSGWLQSWQQPLTTTAGHGDMDHGTGAMGDGMMDPGAMEQLAGAHGGDFDHMFLTMMIEHHQGAVSLSQTEQAMGKFADAKQLAGTIISAQQAEITEMQQLLGTLG